MTPMSTIIPEAALNQHIAVLGKTGAGKTHTAKWIIEQHVADGARVCILDPIKSDHWGLTSSASGKSAGLPFSILGGPKAHAPLPPRSGQVIGSLVASGELPLSIIDMAEFTPRELSDWFLPFAESLVRHMRGVLILVMEEADMFAPKERFGSDQENMRLHWSSRIARTGRSKGIRLIANCTRVQKIHNDMLGSCETLIAHRFTTPADRKPIIEWLSINAEKPIVKQIEATLSSLKNGEAWVCYPEGGHIQRTQIPRIHTYDNSKTPAHGEGARDVKTAAIDIEALRGKLGEAVKEAEANDPKLLRGEIAKLKKQLGGQPSAAPATDPKAIERAVAAAVTARDRDWQRAIKERDGIIGTLKGRMGKAAAILNVNGEANPSQTGPSPQTTSGDTRGSGSVTAPSRTPKAGVLTNALTHLAKSPVAAAAQKPASSASADGTELGKCERAVLQALFWLQGEDPSKAKVAFYAGYSQKSSGFDNAIGRLRTLGLAVGWRMAIHRQSRLVQSFAIGSGPC
jgi:hypothetical protein